MRRRFLWAFVLTIPAVLYSPLGEKILKLTLPAPLPVPEASAALSRLEGFEPTATDREDAARPFLQHLGQFLVDREGIVRWTNIECAREGLAGLGRFPTDEELLAAVRALPA